MKEKIQKSKKMLYGLACMAKARMQRFLGWVKAALSWAAPLLLVLLWLGLAWGISYCVYSGRNSFSLFLLILGSLISGSATIQAARQAGLGSPRPDLSKWLQRFPKLTTFDCQTVDINEGISVGLLAPSVRLRRALPEGAHTDEKIDYLMRECVSIREWAERETFFIKGRIAALTQNTHNLRKYNEQLKIDLRDEIKKVSTSHFYHIIAGFTLVAVGSIVGTWS